MKINFLFYIVKLTLAVVTYMAVLGIANGQTKSLCSKNDTVIFSCTLENKKMLSLCLETFTDEKIQPVLIYNYGAPNHIELRYPNHKIPAPNAFEYALYFRYQTEYFWVNFENTGYLYSIGRYFSGEDNPSKPSIQYRLNVTNAATGKEITSHHCQTIYKDSLLTLSDILLRCSKTEEIGCQ